MSFGSIYLKHGGISSLNSDSCLICHNFFSVPSYPELKSRTSAVKPGQSVGTAAIGGPFKLLNHDGKPVTEKDFMGKWTLLYFGFTHCPDICPDELQKMAAAIDKISKLIRFFCSLGTNNFVYPVVSAYCLSIIQYIFLYSSNTVVLHSI